MVFNETQRRTLQAAVNRVIPADEYPGGWDAGVGDYLERQFGGDLRHLKRLYEEGLDALDAEARSAYTMPFADLDADRQDTLLKKIEQGEIGHGGTLRHFFRLLIEHTAEGYYSDPGNGGNHESVSWKMIGFEVTA